MAGSNEFEGAWELKTLGETAKQILRDQNHQVVVRKLANGDLHFEVWHGRDKIRDGVKSSYDPTTQRLTATLTEGPRQYHFEAALSTRKDFFAKPVLFGLIYPVSGSPEESGGPVGDEGAAGAWASQQQGPPPTGDDD